MPSRGDLDLPLPYLGDLLFAETQRGGTIGARIYKFTAPFTLGSYNDLATSEPVGGSLMGSVSSIKAFGGKIAFTAVGRATHSVGIVDRLYFVPSLGAVTKFTGETVQWEITAKSRPQIGDFGGTCHVLVHQLNSFQFCIANADLGSLSGVATIPSPLGTYMASLETDGLSMYAMLPGGIYNFDDTPSKMIDTSRAEDLNCRQVIFKDQLYFKNKQSLIKYTTPLQSVGYDLEDGLPSDKLGEITAMCSSFKWLYAAVMGATYSHILTNDGKGWQYYARIPTAGLWVRNMFLNNAPDAIDRLWCVFGNYGYPGYFLNPMVNPLNAGTYSYVPTGHFTPPIFDGGMPEELGAFYDANIISDGMVGSNRITCLYGLNGTSPVTTLGVVATSTESLILGSPYGLEGYKIQPKFILSGVVGSSTPIFQEAIIHYLKLPEDREAFEFTIDLEQTAIRETRPLEAVIGSLNYERQKRTLMPFWYGQIGTKNVKILEAPSSETVENQQIYEGEREGFIRIRCAEII